MSGLVVFTDLDGTLLDEGVHGWSGARTALAKLAQLEVPVVPVTSRTRREVERLRAAAGLTGPYIVENGSAVFAGSLELSAFAGSSMYRLGCTRDEAEAARRELERRLGVQLQSLSDLPVEEISRITGLTREDAGDAAAREFGSVILQPEIEFERVHAAAAEIGFGLIEGDRFWHLVGPRADKGRAVRWLLARMDPDVTSVALGNGPSDVSVLDAVDIPVIVPGPAGAHPSLAVRGWRVAPMPGSSGWGQAVLALLDERAARTR